MGNNSLLIKKTTKVNNVLEMCMHVYTYPHILLYVCKYIYINF